MYDAGGMMGGWGIFGGGLNLAASGDRPNPRNRGADQILAKLTFVDVDRGCL